MTWRCILARPLAVTVVISLGGGMQHAVAQEARLQVAVEAIAGANIYLGVGTEDGLAAGDTIAVQQGPGRPGNGRIVVISASLHRAVVTFLGDPFPITRGEAIVLIFHPRRDAQPAAAAEPASVARRQPLPSPGLPRARGRLSFDVTGLESRTSGLGSSPEQVSRRFATPTLRLRTTITELPGGFEFSTNLRASSRYSSGTRIQPVQSLRVYQASLSKSFRDAPVRLEIGRFYNRYENYSGYWDGVLLRVGRDGIGGGVAIGLEPKRANELVQGNAPKYTAFVDYGYRGPTLRYSTDLSVHRVQGTAGVPGRTFAGWSQYLGAGPVTIRQRVQVDRNPESGTWVLSDLRLHASTAIARGVYLTGGISSRRPYAPWRREDLFSYRRDRGTLGLTLSGRAGSITFSTAANRIEDGDVGWSYGSSAGLSRLPGLGVSLYGGVRYWTQGVTNGLYVYSGMRRAFGRVESQIGYQYYNTRSSASAVTTHAGELSLMLPLTARLYSNLRFFGQRGEHLVSNSLYTGLWMSF